jgi:hypothetical protein
MKNLLCIILTGVILFMEVQSASAADSMYSRDIGCKKVTNARGKEICQAIADNMEWTWMGHAIISPGWRLTWDGLRKVYCSKHIIPADLPALQSLQKSGMAGDWRLESSAGELISLVKNADGKGDEPENSLFNPKNPQYILKGGC